MTDEIQVDEAPVQDEMTMLKKRADQLGVKYHPNIGLEKLRDKVNAKMTGETEPADDEEEVVQATADPVKKQETKQQMRVRLQREAAKLIRVNITCMNPNKRDLEGEIFTAGNSIVGSYKKYVPFNTENGWHVPQIILNQIKQRKCQIFVTVRDDRGNKSRKGKLINEFSVEELKPLTKKELEDLAKRQAMANGTAEEA